MRRELFGRSSIRTAGRDSPSELIEKLDAAQKAWRKQFLRA
jgi:hypothetical protein